jgi:hypothetical protein
MGVSQLRQPAVHTALSLRAVGVDECPTSPWLVGVCAERSCRYLDGDREPIHHIVWIDLLPDLEHRAGVMLGDEPGGCFGVASLRSVEDHTVFVLAHGISAVGGGDVLKRTPVTSYLFPKPAQLLGVHRSCSACQEHVKPAMGTLEVVPFADIRQAARFSVQAFELSVVGVGELVNGHPHRRRVERNAQDTQLLNLLGRQVCGSKAPVGLPNNQMLKLKHAQSLSQRSPADSQRFGQLRLGPGGACGDLTSHDGLSDTVPQGAHRSGRTSVSVTNIVRRHESHFRQPVAGAGIQCVARAPGGRG